MSGGYTRKDNLHGTKKSPLAAKNKGFTAAIAQVGKSPTGGKRSHMVNVCFLYNHIYRITLV
jgi:hypothetical protein